MAPPRVLLVVLAGGAGGRLELLTRDRAKPAVPYAGRYRLIDFPMSNALHSGFRDVWVMQQFHPRSLGEHLSNGRPWDLDRTTGGLLVLHPYQGTDRAGWQEGTADGLWRQAENLRDFAPDALVVVSADAVYRLDYDEVVQEHLGSGAAVTMVTTRVDPEDAGRYGVVQVDGSGGVSEYVYKPDDPSGDLVSNEVFVFDPTRTLDVLEEIAQDAGQEGLADLGTALLPRLVDEGGAREHRFEDYWRDVGTVEAYHASHLDLLGAEPVFDLDDPGWPIYTKGGAVGPARLARGSSVHDCLVAGEAVVEGTVERSVIGVDVRVAPGAVVRESVLLPGAVVRSGARIERAVVDESAEIGPDAVVGGDGDVALVGAGERVPAGSTLAPGGRFPSSS